MTTNPTPEDAERLIAETADLISRVRALVSRPALMTGQRRGDLVKARWSDYDGRGIEFLQQKTGSFVYVPVPSLVDQLDARKKAAKGLTIIAGRFGRPYTPHGFSTAWVKAEHLAFEGKVSP